MAVGPFDPAEFCVTGGTVASVLEFCANRLGSMRDLAEHFAAVAEGDKLFESCVAD